LIIAVSVGWFLVYRIRQSEFIKKIDFSIMPSWDRGAISAYALLQVDDSSGKIYLSQRGKNSISVYSSDSLEKINSFEAARTSLNEVIKIYLDEQNDYGLVNGKAFNYYNLFDLKTQKKVCTIERAVVPGFIDAVSKRIFMSFSDKIVAYDYQCQKVGEISFPKGFLTSKPGGGQIATYSQETGELEVFDTASLRKISGYKLDVPPETSMHHNIMISKDWFVGVYATSPKSKEKSVVSIINLRSGKISYLQLDYSLFNSDLHHAEYLLGNHFYLPLKVDGREKIFRIDLGSQEQKIINLSGDPVGYGIGSSEKRYYLVYSNLEIEKFNLE
jgi:WD40 repeat protein